VFSNPASAVFTNVYSIDGTYFGAGGFSTSVLDTKTSSVGGGAGFYRMASPVPGKFNQGLRLALMSKITPNIGWGVAGKILWGENAPGQEKNIKDLDLGVLFDYSVVQFGATVRNIFGGDPSYLEQNRELGIGARINYEQVLFLSVAAYSKFEKFVPYQLSVGAEYVSPYYFSLRGGFRARPEEQVSFWSAGVGVSSGKFGIHYAVEFPNQSANTQHLLNMDVML
ncbi:MAG: hypothetical protein KDD51_07420, partial [Bdellovibrionales bacterium]|nr:hypothetical protein [Bdellovibrionales bacterium]